MTSASWTAASGDFNTAADWSTGTVPGAGTGDVATIDAASVQPYTVSLSGFNGASVASILLNNARATLQVNSLSTLHLTSGISLQAGMLALNGGTVTGGRIVQSGGNVMVGPYQSSTLDGTGVTGTLNLASSLAIVHGAAVAGNLFSAADGSAGTVNIGTGNVGTGPNGAGLQFLDSETLDNVTVNIASGLYGSNALSGSYGAPTTLTLGAHATLNVAAGQIGGTYTGPSFQLVNNGQITVATRLEITAQSNLVAGTGSLALARAATLKFDSAIAASALAAVTSGGGTVEIGGTLDNTGHVLTLSSSSAIGTLLLDEGATLLGGTVALSGTGTIAFTNAVPYSNPAAPVLDGVTIQGALTLGTIASGFSGAPGAVEFKDGLTLTGAAGGGGQLTIAGANLRATSNETLDHAAITLSSGSLAAASGNTLTLGANLAATITGVAGLLGSVVDNGSIVVQAGGKLTVDSLSGAGSVTVQAGGVLVASGTLAALLPMIKGVAGTLEIDKTLDASGTTLQTGGVFAGILLNGGTLVSGTLAGVANLPTLQVSATGGSEATLSGVALKGPVSIVASTTGQIFPATVALGVKGGLTMVASDGTSAGSVTLSGVSFDLLDTETLDNARITLMGSSGLTALTGQSALAIGSGAVVDVAGITSFTTRSGGTIINNGQVIVEAGHMLTVDAGFTNAGRITVAYGGKLLASGAQTTASYLSLLSGITGQGFVGLAPGVMLDNTAATLDLTPYNRLWGLTANAATIHGGTVINDGGSSAYAPSTTTLDGVGWVGQLGAGAANRQSYVLTGGASVRTASGGVGVIDLTGGGSLTIDGAIDRVSITVGSNGLIAGPDGATLGSSATAMILGSSAGVGGFSYAGLTNAGTINVAGLLAEATLVNTGSINVSHGVLDAAVLTNTGTVTLASGGTLSTQASVLGGTIAFGDGLGKVAFSGYGASGATLARFQRGDSIDLAGLQYGAGVSIASSGSLAQVLSGSTVAASFNLVGGGYTGDDFRISPDSTGGTLVTSAHQIAPVYATGVGVVFDAAFYLQHNPDVAASGMDPLQQYLTAGWKQGRDPSAFFSTKYYLNQNPDVAAAGVNPLLHYYTSGATEGRDPSILFSDAAYLAANPDVAAARVNPLQHYLVAGRYEGRAAPAATPRNNGPQDALVDNAFYYAAHPDVAASGMTATQHYNTLGWKLGYNPDRLFDTTYYLNTNADVRAAGINPLAHFESAGYAEARNPSLAFNDASYLKANPDVAAAKVDPLLHYLVAGQFEGRATFITGAVNVAGVAQDPLVDRAFYLNQLATIIPGSVDASASFHTVGWHAGLSPDAFFDVNYYLSHNPDVAAAKVDPLLHYEGSGWTEGRNPSAAFSTNKYLAANPDVKTDPLVQFLTTGAAQGRLAIPV